MRYFLTSLVVLMALAASVALVVRSFQQNSGPETARVEPAPAPKTVTPEERIATTPPPPAESPPAAVPPAVPSSGELFTQQPFANPPFAPGGPPFAAPPAAQGSIAPAGRLRLNAEQAERVRYVLLSHNVMQAEVTGVPLKIGGAVPQGVELSPLPIELADAVPAFAHYSYVILQNQIAIVTNEKREIEALIPFS